MKKQTLNVSKRDVSGRKVKSLRRKGFCPCNIYGKKIDSLSVSVDSKIFLKLFSEVGESTLIYLHVEGEKDARPVFIKEVVKHPVTQDLLHVVFNQVNLKEKVIAPVPVELVGESPAEKEKLGILVQQLDELEIEALPTDMPESIQVDVSKLDQEGDHIKASDLKLDSKLTLQTDPESIIVQIEALAKEEVAPPPPSETVEEGVAEDEKAEGAKTDADTTDKTDKTASSSESSST